MNLYHLSFRSDLPTILKPRLPDGSGMGTPLYPEPEIPRISVGASIVGCFQALYPNISQYFETEHYPYMEFWVYMPVSVDPKDLVYPLTLTKSRWVWDAFKTEEHWITKPTRFRKQAKIRILNTEKNPDVLGHPFNDPKEPKRYMFPDLVQYELVSGTIPN